MSLLPTPITADRFRQILLNVLGVLGIVLVVDAVITHAASPFLLALFCIASFLMGDRTTRLQVSDFFHFSSLKDQNKEEDEEG